MQWVAFRLLNYVNTKRFSYFECEVQTGHHYSIDWLVRHVFELFASDHIDKTVPCTPGTPYG